MDTKTMALVVAIACLLSGCITNYTSTTDASNFGTPQIYGNREYLPLDANSNRYYLPKGWIHIDITASSSGNNTNSSPTEPTAPDGYVTQSLSEGTSSRAQTKAQANTDVNAPLLKDVIKRAQEQAEDVAALIKKPTTDGSSQAAKPTVWTIKITPVMRPDTDTCYVLHTKKNDLFDESTTVAIDPSTLLLKTVNSTATDETVASIGNLVAAIGSVFTFGAAINLPTGTHIEGGPNPPQPSLASQLPPEWHHDYDPDCDDDIERLPDNKLTDQTNLLSGFRRIYLSNDGVKVTTFCLRFKYKGLFAGQGRKNPSPTPDESKSAEKDVPGIVVRIPVPYEVTAYQENVDEKRVIEQDQTAVVMLPSTRDFMLPIQSRFLVQDTTNLTLVNGMLASVQESKPSMVAAVIGVPKTILGALVPIPLNIRQSQSQNLQAIDNSLKAENDIKAGQ